MQTAELFKDCDWFAIYSVTCTLIFLFTRKKQLFWSGIYHERLKKECCTDIRER